MNIVKYSELVHMAETHSQARASSPYELVPNILRYSFNNLYYIILYYIILYYIILYYIILYYIILYGYCTDIDEYCPELGYRRTRACDII